MNNLTAQKLSTSLLATFMVVMMITTSGCSESKSEAKEEPAIAMVPVHVDTVSRGDIDAAYGTTAILEAAQEAEVASRQEGVVVKLFVEEGDYVTEGQLLAQLETDQLELELKRAEANLKQLENELARQERIYQKNLVSSEVYERIKFEHQAQKAQTDLARLNLEYASVRAPISGVVANRYIKVGNMLKHNQAAFHITDMAELHAIIHLPESEKADLKKGQTAYLKVSSQEQPIMGHIDRISPIVDKDTGTIRVTVSVRTADTELKPGMFSRVGIIYDTHQDALLIPKQALLTEDNDAYVFTVLDGKAHKTSVTTGFINQDYVEITDGIEQNDLVITVGQRNLRDKTDVEIINTVAQL